MSTRAVKQVRGKKGEVHCLKEKCNTGKKLLLEFFRISLEAPFYIMIQSTNLA